MSVLINCLNNVIGLLAPKLLLKEKVKVQELTDCVCLRYKRELNYRTISLMPMYVYKISSLEFKKKLTCMNVCILATDTPKF